MVMGTAEKALLNPPLRLKALLNPPLRSELNDTPSNPLSESCIIASKIFSFNPAIEIWNLDVLDPLEPSATLGGIKDGELGGAAGKKKSSKRGKKSIPKMRPGSHTDAVMSLSWNKLYRQALASGSSDNLVKIWDVTTHKCSHTWDYY